MTLWYTGNTTFKGSVRKNGRTLVPMSLTSGIPMDIPSQILCPESGRAHEEDEIYPSEVSRAEAEAHLLEALNALDDPRCQCMDIWIDDKHSRRRYYGRSTKLGKKLESMIVKPVEKEELRKHTDELFRLLSCPSDDLSDVRIPASGLYGESIYNIFRRRERYRGFIKQLYLTMGIFSSRKRRICGS